MNFEMKTAVEVPQHSHFANYTQKFALPIPDFSLKWLVITEKTQKNRHGFIKHHLQTVIQILILCCTFHPWALKGGSDCRERR